MRRLAAAVLLLYPRAWRARYGEEVRDLVASRPVRPRTVADLLMGAADAWIHRGTAIRARGLSPGLAVPVLAIGAWALLFLWNPGIRDVPSLQRGWGAARETGALARILA
ncbi:hypothetical protein [Microbispora sp. ATCC PTA-5024]|uniref:hypothetical protein n=1 Tax=Microbispora sp. ATCC PTA-5024 TaxID=316330 RepID=UPI0003DD53ED|nr:hypothetical protein [Microbispora sp. ATCC PTA-5024]ETK35959.1 hypothetical protein MPTA5024_11610 [Microbispora sp. ATCC PTA-5024]